MAGETCDECGAVNDVVAPETRVAGGAFRDNIRCAWCQHEMRRVRMDMGMPQVTLLTPGDLEKQGLHSRR